MARFHRRILASVLGLYVAMLVTVPQARAQDGDDTLQPGLNIVVPQRRVWQEGQRRSAIETIHSMLPSTRYTRSPIAVESRNIGVSNRWR